MTPVHERSHSPDAANKRLKTSHTATNGNNVIISDTVGEKRATIDHTAQFATGVFDHNATSKLHETYVANEPFKYAVVEALFQDDLLKKVKDECLRELNFMGKETDIYKVNQTGDLASLSYLSDSQIALLPNLLTLRDALYSRPFRKFLQTVTGCGPLSGKKQDMSVNSYTNGCHLLNHDDVIGTRCVSYILYMPLPHDTSWQKDWGGALELYPVKMGADGGLEPESAPSKSIPPSWNQFIFFEVQPGRSFHSVEEVVVGGERQDGRERLSISGWFHAAQEGEEEYLPEATLPEIKSSREQLTSTSTIFKPYPTYHDPPHPETALSEDYIGFLQEFLNPVYLQPRTMETLSSRFVEESSLELHSFLSNTLADALQPRLRDMDSKDGLDESRKGRIPPHSAGTQGAWAVKGPPHKWRYCVLAPPKEDAPAVAVIPRAAGSLGDIMRSLQNELFPSPAFRAWLAIVTQLFPMSYATEARRFRPGLDYTLATSDEDDVRLDVVLGLTPEIKEDSNRNPVGLWNRARKLGRSASRGWQAAEWGGWECYMAPHNEEEDPAVYRSGTQKKPRNDTLKGTYDATGEDSSSRSTYGKGVQGAQLIDEDESIGEEEDSTLLTVQPGFNRLLLVLRDARVMRFVKYVSAAAEGSRWDVCGEYEVGMVEEDQSDDGE